MNHGKSSDVSLQMNFDTSWRGLPYHPRIVSKEEIASLRERHCWTKKLTPEEVEIVFVTADVMDDFNAYAVYAWDIHDNLWMLECGRVPFLEIDEAKREELDRIAAEEKKEPVKCLQDIVDKQYLGFNIGLVLVDAGGHRAQLVEHFIRQNWNIAIQQKGTAMVQNHFKLSDKFKYNHMLISNANYWKATAIYQLYSQKDTKENYLWFTSDITEEQLAEIRDVQPDTASKFGHLPENWKSRTGEDHVFDTIKYSYLAKDFMLQYYLNDKFNQLKAPSLLKRLDKIRQHN